MSDVSNNKRIAKNTVMLYCRMLITMAVGFYTSRVVLNTLGVVDYGIYNVVGGVVGMLSMLNGSMAGATQRWITIALGEGNEEKLKKVFAGGMTAQGIMALIVFVLAETVGLWFFYNHTVIPEDRMDAAFWVLQISIVTMILTIINVPFNGAIIAHEKMGAFAFFSIIDVTMKLLICFVLYVTTSDKLIIYTLLLFTTFLINFSIIKIYCHRHFVEAKFRFGWDTEMYKEMWGLAFWTISGNLAYVGYGQGITLLINNFFGPVMNTAVTVASQAGNIINQFSSNFQIAMNPQITKTYAVRDYENMHKLIFRSAKFSYFLMLILSIPLFFEAELLLKLWLNFVPEHSVAFLRIGLFISMFTAVRNPLVIAAMANGNLKKYQFVVNGILLMVCPISYLFLKLGCIPETTYIVFLFVMISATLASAYMLRTLVLLDFHLFVTKVFYKLLSVTLLSYIIPSVFYVYMPAGFTRFLVLSVVSVCISILVIYYCGFDMTERNFVQTIIKKKILKR